MGTTNFRENTCNNAYYSTSQVRTASMLVLLINLEFRKVIFLSLSPHADWLWGPPRLLSKGYRCLSWEWSSWGMKLTIHLH